jgi:hypothetical protein
MLTILKTISPTVDQAREIERDGWMSNALLRPRKVKSLSKGVEVSWEE